MRFAAWHSIDSVLSRVVQALQDAGVPYMLTGSFASSTTSAGMPLSRRTVLKACSTLSTSTPAGKLTSSCVNLEHLAWRSLSVDTRPPRFQHLFLPLHQTRPMAVLPRCLDQHSSQMRVARLGDRTLSSLRARGVLARGHACVTHHTRRFLESSHGTKLYCERHSAQLCHSAKRLQPLDDFL